MKTCHGGSDTWTNNKEKICIVEVIRDTSDNRLYVHEAFSIEKLLKNAASNSVRDGNAVSPHSQGAVAKVLQEIVNSRDSSKIVDDIGEPRWWCADGRTQKKRLSGSLEMHPTCTGPESPRNAWQI